MRVAARILVVTLAVSVGLAPVLWGAEAKPGDTKKPVATNPADLKPSPKPVAVNPVEKKPGVVAVVNGSEVPMDDFFREFLRLERLVLNAGRIITCPQITRLRTDVAEGLVRRELLFQESKSKVKVTDAEIAAEVKKLRDQYASEKDFTATLGSMNISQASLRAQVERALSIQKYMDTFAAKASVDDKEIWAYYDKNRNSFRQPEQVKASQILIKTDPSWDEARKAAARKKIDDIRAKLKAGQDFESLARTYSEDPSGPKGGDLGYIRTGQVLKPFEDALFALKPGETSDVVETSLGYHIIKAVDRKPETTIPFEKVKDQLRTALKQEKGQQEANAYIGKVREKARVEIFLPPEE
ncbi:MAG: peptidylprolyl isomerase [Syntrophorhabdales bacterium]|jgi:peptidyl-prolyl cis-trans isomerase C